MHILITTIFDIPHTGGLSTHVETLKAGLEEKGHTVKVLSFSDVDKLTQLLYVKGPSFIMNRIIRGKGIVWSQQARKRLLLNNIRKYILKNKVDIINAQDAFATIASSATSLPTVMTTHGYMAYEMISKGSVPEESSASRFLHNLETSAYKKADRVLTVDDRIRNYVMDKASVEAFAIKNFINITDFEPNRERRKEFRQKYQLSDSENILFIPRRLTRKNGVIQPVKALPKVLEKYPNTRLLYAGNGEERAEIENLAKKLGIQQNVTLLGSIPHKIMREYYALSDIVLVPSIHSHGVEEATSISALEAMASGIPIVAGAVGGLKQLITDETHGLLINAEIPEKLALAIGRILDNPNEGLKMAQNARSKIESEHSHLTAAQRFSDEYETLLLEKSDKNV